MWVLLLVLIWSGCAEQPKTIQAYKAWFLNPDHGYVQTKEVAGIHYSVQYRPGQLMILNEMNSKIKTRKMVDSMVASYGESKYFVLELSLADNAKSQDHDILKAASAGYKNFADNINYLSFHLEKETWLIVDQDTLSPSLYHFERGYELGNKQSFVFAFPAKNAANAEMKFVFNDAVFNTGTNTFKFKPTPDIPDVPIN